MQRSSPKVAIVHDWLYGGGAEKVVEQLHILYPEAPIYTSYCSDEWRQRLDNKVITGYLQRSPFKQLRKFLVLPRQLWFGRLDLSDYDIVVSSSGNGEAKFIKVKNGVHINYCHTPVHFYWRHYDQYINNPGFRPKWLIKIALKLLVKPLRKRDFNAAQNVDYFIANSTHIQNDIKKYYHKDSEVIFPPVDTERFISYRSPNKRSGYVTLGRQVPMKRIDLIVQALKESDETLTIIGNGPEHEKLKQLADNNVIFKTNITDSEMPAELSKAKAFIFASFEDFGIAPVEALACGTPVIAYGQGGVLDYVIDNKTGITFKEQTVQDINKAIKQFEAVKFSHSDISKFTNEFSASNFRNKVSKFITKSAHN